MPVSAGSIKVAFYLPIWWLYIFYELFFTHWDVVHATDFDTYVPSLLMAKIKKKLIIYDIFDFYADMIQFPIFPKFSSFLFSKIDRFLMRFADVVILADDSRIKQIGCNANKNIITINNCPKEEYLSNDFPDKTKDQNFTIFFGGIVQEDRGIIDMILAVKDFNNVNLIIMGYTGSPMFEVRLSEMCKDLTNVKLHLFPVQHNEIILNTTKADLLFAIYDTNVPNNKFASPNKLFESMMFSKPILVSDCTSMANIVREENCGIVVSYGDINSIKKAIFLLKDDLNLRRKLGSNGRKAYDSKYNWAIMEHRLLGIYSDLLNKGSHPTKD